MTTTNIEEKLGWNVFKVDEEPHIVINQEVCQSKCQVQYCLHVCPADLYKVNEQSGEIQVNCEGCLECGTCLIACTDGALTWEYPNAGFGVQYRFG
jgi:ferredoxin like protein